MTMFGGPNAPEKLCIECFRARFPDRTAAPLTWGRECTQCRKPTPSLSTLVKVDRAEVSS